LSLEAQDRITKILEAKPTYLVPKAVLEILSQCPQPARLGIRLQNVSDKGDDVVAVGPGVRTKASAGGPSKDLGFRIKGDVDVNPLSGWPTHEAKVRFPSEVNMRNSRTLREVETLFEHIRIELACDLCW